MSNNKQLDINAEGQVQDRSGVDIDQQLKEAGENMDRARNDAKRRRSTLEKELKEQEKAKQRLEEERTSKEQKDRERQREIEEKRLEELSYAENYRSNLRAQNEKNEAARRKREEAKREEQMRQRLMEQQAANDAVEKDREAAKARSEKVKDILSRVGKAVTITSNGEIKPYDELITNEEKKSLVDGDAKAPAIPAGIISDEEYYEVPDSKEDEPKSAVEAENEKKDGSVSPRVENNEEKASDFADDYTIKIDSDIERHVLHISGGHVSDITVQEQTKEGGSASGGVLAVAANIAARDRGEEYDNSLFDTYRTSYRVVSEDVDEEITEPLSQQTLFDEEEEKTAIARMDDGQRNELVYHDHRQKLLDSETDDYRGISRSEKEGEILEHKRRYTKEEKKLREAEMIALLTYGEEYLSIAKEDDHPDADYERDLEAVDADKASRSIRRRRDLSDDSAREEEMIGFLRDYDKKDRDKKRDLDATKKASRQDERTLEKIIEQQKKNDLDYLKTRFDYSIRNIEKDEKYASFTYGKQTARSRKKMKKARYELKHIKSNVKRAMKYERMDNDRYYNILRYNVNGIKIPKGTDPGEIQVLTDKLGRLLRRRDSINLRLTELYLGSNKGLFGKGVKGRDTAELKGRKREFARQRALQREIVRNRVPYDGKKKLYELMNERIALAGSLASIEYILSKEKPKGKARRAFRIERRKILSAMKDNAFDLKKYSRKILNKAKDRQMEKRSVVVGVIALVLIAGIAFGVWYFRDQIMAYVNSLIEQFSGGM